MGFEKCKFALQDTVDVPNGVRICKNNFLRNPGMHEFAQKLRTGAFSGAYSALIPRTGLRDVEINNRKLKDLCKGKIVARMQMCNILFFCDGKFFKRATYKEKNGRFYTSCIKNDPLCRYRW